MTAENFSQEIVKEVEAAISEYSTTGRIPRTVNEMNMFRKLHFNGMFLPCLLSDVISSDEKTSFVEALKAKKIIKT